MGEAKKPNVLYVEHDSTLRFVIAESPASNDALAASMTTVASGAEALGLIEERAFDVVIAPKDLEHKRDFGITLLGEVKQKIAQAKTILTTKEHPEENARLLRTHSDELDKVLGIPFDLETLRHAIHEVLRK